MSQEDKTPVRTGDPATDEILNSMEEDGMELPDNLKPKAPVLSKKENEGDRPDEGEEESKPDESEEEDEFKADFDESDKEEGEEESKDEEEEDDDSVGLSPSASRPSAQRPGEYIGWNGKSTVSQRRLKALQPTRQSRRKRSRKISTRRLRHSRKRTV